MNSWNWCWSVKLKIIWPLSLNWTEVYKRGFWNSVHDKAERELQKAKTKPASDSVQRWPQRPERRRASSRGRNRDSSSSILLLPCAFSGMCAICWWGGHPHNHIIPGCLKAPAPPSSPPPPTPPTHTTALKLFLQPHVVSLHSTDLHTRTVAILISAATYKKKNEKKSLQCSSCRRQPRTVVMPAFHKPLGSDSEYKKSTVCSPQLSSWLLIPDAAASHPTLQTAWNPRPPRTSFNKSCRLQAGKANNASFF